MKKESNIYFLCNHTTLSKLSPVKHPTLWNWLYQNQSTIKNNIEEKKNKFGVVRDAHIPEYFLEQEVYKQMQKELIINSNKFIKLYFESSRTPLLKIWPQK